MERFFRPLDSLGRMEASVGNSPGDFFRLDIRPAETAPTFYEIVIDALSLHLQHYFKTKYGIKLPDLRFRIVTYIETDSIEGVHFGTLNGAIKYAWKLRDRMIAGIEESLGKEGSKDKADPQPQPITLNADKQKLLPPK